MKICDYSDLIPIKDNLYRIPYFWRSKKGYRYFYLTKCSSCEKEMFQEGMSYRKGLKPQCGCGEIRHKHEFFCINCGQNSIKRFRSDEVQKLCSRKCFFEWINGPNNPNWRNGRKGFKPIDESIRTLINLCLREPQRSSPKLKRLLGYSAEDLRRYIKRKFKIGMNWDNRNDWHIDHIIPRSAFNYNSAKDLDFKRAWSLKNLQVLWKAENLEKHAKLKDSFQPSLRLEV